MSTLDGQSPESLFYSRNLTTEQQYLNFQEMTNVGKINFLPGSRYHIISRVFSKHNKVDSLIEIGCNSGESLAVLKEYAEICVGADIALTKYLKSLSSDSFQFVEFNANNNFPLADSSFDVVVAMMLIEHLFDPFHFCSEVYRILKPGSGLFFLNVPLITPLKHRLTLLSRQMPVTSNKNWFDMKEWDGGHLHYFTFSLLKKLLNLHQLEILHITGVGKLSYLKTLFPGLLAAEVSICCRKSDIA